MHGLFLRAEEHVGERHYKDRLTVLVKVGGGLVVVALHGVAAGGPVGGADLAVDVGVLEGLDEAEDLIDRAADGRVVDGDVAEDTLVVNDEETARE